jgi:hypothetical protein
MTESQSIPQSGLLSRIEVDDKVRFVSHICQGSPRAGEWCW